jgi:hypothetical protein
LLHSPTRLNESELWDENDQKGSHVMLYNHSGDLLGSLVVIEAENSDFSLHSGIKECDLEHCIYVTRAIVHFPYTSTRLK